MTINDIQTLVAHEWRLTVCDLLSRRRSQRLVVPRHVAMWLARQATLHSLPEIGQAFGGRDHTTVMHALDLVETRLADDADYAVRVWRLLAAVDSEKSVEIRRLRLRGEAA